MRSYSLDTDGAFCNGFQKDYYHKRFPVDLPDKHIPWVWEAVESSDRKIVEIAVISRNACKFNYTEWKYLVNRFPMHANQLGDGLDGNIYVETDPLYNYVGTNHHLDDEELREGILNRYVTCLFVDKEDNIVFSERSLRIADDDIAELATLQIRCPAPPSNVSWYHMRLERLNNYKQGTNSSTAAFPVCRSNQLHSSVTNSEKRHKISVCTATARKSRSHFVEWIEYHRLMGIDHFYIYDTTDIEHIQYNRDNNVLSIMDILSDYIWENVVTVIKWPYSNCVRNMASGRWVSYNLINGSRNSSTNKYFFPPRAIAQTAALSSCYMRFKGVSDWIAHIDDDEFLVSYYIILDRC